MTEVLVLDPPEAEKVRGCSPKDGGCALDPVPLKDGRFFLGLEVLDDPAHEDVRDFLRSMPLVDIEKLPRYGEDDMAEAKEPEPFKVRAALWSPKEVEAFRDNVPIRKR